MPDDGWVHRHHERGFVTQAAIFVAVLGAGVGVAPLAHAALPRESPLYGSPYRQGLLLDVGVGLSVCQPAFNYPSRCGGSSLGSAAPGFALRIGAGWRFNPHWQLTGAWVRQGHRPAGDYVAGASDGGMVAVRGIVPLTIRGTNDIHLDLGFELGLGWSQRKLTRAAGDPGVQSSSGALVRPALVLDTWLLADFAIGFEVAPHLNLHWRYCVDEMCEPRPGDWVPALVEQRWVDGVTFAVRVTGLIFPRI